MVCKKRDNTLSIEPDASRMKILIEAKRQDIRFALSMTQQ